MEQLACWIWSRGKVYVIFFLKTLITCSNSGLNNSHTHVHTEVLLSIMVV